MAREELKAATAMPDQAWRLLPEPDPTRFHQEELASVLVSVRVVAQVDGEDQNGGQGPGMSSQLQRNDATVGGYTMSAKSPFSDTR